MKPSLCGAIVLLGRRWHGRKVIRAVPIGQRIPPKTLEWLMAYSRKQAVPLLFSERLFKNNRFIGKKFIGYGPQDFIHAVQTEVGPEDIMR